MEQIKAPINAIIVTAMGWLRYSNEVNKEKGALFLPDTALELQALWGIGEVEDVAKSIKDPYIHENIIVGATILFLFAPCAPLDGQKVGNPGRYAVRSFAVHGYWPPGELTPTVTEIYQRITDFQSLQSPKPPHADGATIHRGEYPPPAESPILVARGVVNGVF